MATTPEVLAICVNWNGAAVLGQTLASLLRSDYPALKVLVVDNASTDGSDRIPVHFGLTAEILRLDNNLGYAAAINAGIRLVRDSPHEPTYYLVVNNDIQIESNTVSGLVRQAQKSGPGVYGPKILQAEQRGRLEAAWGRVSWSHVLVSLTGKGAIDGARWDHTQQVEVLLGSLLLIHNEVLSKVGEFDEQFFMYHEEVDFLFRARKLGLAAFYCPAVRAYHHGGHSTRAQPMHKVYWTRRNTVLFLRKHGRWFHWLYFTTSLGLSLLYNLSLFRGKRAGMIARGALDGLRRGVATPVDLQQP